MSIIQNRNHSMNVEARLSRTNFLNNDEDNSVKLSIDVKPTDDLRRRLNQKQGVDICIVLDRSRSMGILLDTNGMVPTKKWTKCEQNEKKMLARGGKCRLKVAVEAAKNIVDMMQDEDTLSCVVFADFPVTIFKGKKGIQKEEIKKALDYDVIKSINCGVNTNITEALRMAEQTLDSKNSVNVKKIIFLTDGEPNIDTKAQGIAQAKKVADAGITLDCIGLGSHSANAKDQDQANFSYLQALSAPSNGKGELIYDAQSVMRMFVGRMKKAQEVLITDAKLKITFSNDIRVTEHYRAVPDNTYLGKVKLGKSRELVINLGQIEKNQRYAYYMELIVPGKENYLGDFSVLKAEVEYKIPALYGPDQVLNTMVYTLNGRETAGQSFKLTATSVNDPVKARRKDGEIESRYMLAEVKRYEAESEIAMEKGDKNTVIAIYKKIIEIYTKLQSRQEAQMYQSLLNTYIETNKVDRSVWNKITSTTSQSGDSGELTDLGVKEMSEITKGIQLGPVQI